MNLSAKKNVGKNLIYEIKFKRSFQKALENIPESYRKRIREKINEIKTNPYLGENLKGDLSFIRKIRIGDYRIAYVVENSTLTIIMLKVGPRQNFYDKLMKLIKGGL